MADDVKSAPEIAAAIKEQAGLSLGLWPRDLELFHRRLKVRLELRVSPATQTSGIEYREGVLEIARVDDDPYLLSTEYEVISRCITLSRTASRRRQLVN
jgi:hypothetical protein